MNSSGPWDFHLCQASARANNETNDGVNNGRPWKAILMAAAGNNSQHPAALLGEA